MIKAKINLNDSNKDIFDRHSTLLALIHAVKGVGDFYQISIDFINSCFLIFSLHYYGSNYFSKLINQNIVQASMQLYKLEPPNISALSFWRYVV